MISSVSNIVFQASPYATAEKLKNKTLNRTLANNKATEILAKNETVEKSIPKKKNNKKKLLTTILLTVGTVVGLAIIGNKSSNYMASLGQKVDDLLINQKWYQSLEKNTSKFKKKVSNFFLNNKNKLIKESATDIAETLKNRHAQPTLDLARGYGRGFTSIFGLTPVDILRTSLNKIEKQNPGQAIKSLEKLVGKEKAGVYFEQLVKNGQIVDNQQFCEKLTQNIAKNFGAIDSSGKIDTKKLLNLFKDLEKGKVNNIDFSEFTKVKMDEGGLMAFMSSWWPANFIDSIGNKTANLFGKKWM